MSGSSADETLNSISHAVFFFGKNGTIIAIPGHFGSNVVTVRRNRSKTSHMGTGIHHRRDLGFPAEHDKKIAHQGGFTGGIQLHDLAFP